MHRPTTAADTYFIGYDWPKPTELKEAKHSRSTQVAETAMALLSAMRLGEDIETRVQLLKMYRRAKSSLR